ncbi:MAG: hypothetical protein IJ200_04025 [Prevotella sp.]|nr:hypothetical protein [Prevotella sp.]
MKRNYVFLGFLLIMVSLLSCTNETINKEPLDNNKTIAIKEVKSELYVLNASYKGSFSSQKRMPKWLRWLIFAAADAAGGVGGGVGGACAASTLAWNVTKDELKQDTGVQPDTTHHAQAIKSNSLEGLELGSAGYIHNSVISSVYYEYNDLSGMSTEEIINIVFNELESQTGVEMPASKKLELASYALSIIDSFDASKTVEEFFNDLIEQTANPTQKETLEICGMILDGLQYVDDSDTSYVDTATTIIVNSNLDSELKATLVDVISVANASAKLWNTDGIVIVP